MKSGYLYIATGEKYIEEALISLRSLKQINKDAHATLITDKMMEVPEFDRIQILKFEKSEFKNWKEGILFKVLGLQDSPYQKTFFVDTDTYFTSNCDQLFDLLDYFDLLICHDQARNPKVVLGNKEIEGYEAYNTGVMVYQKNDAINKLFSKWLTVYKEKNHLYPHDQPPLMEALLSVHVKIYTLPLEYNFRFGFFGYLKENVKIIHGRPKDFKEVETKINSIARVRVWLPDIQKNYLPKINILNRVLKKISSNRKTE